MVLSGWFMARSYVAWRLSQNSGVVSRDCASNQAVSEVIPRLPRTIYLIRWTGTLMCAEKATWLMAGRMHGFD